MRKLVILTAGQRFVSHDAKPANLLALADVIKQHREYFARHGITVAISDDDSNVIKLRRHPARGAS